MPTLRRLLGAIVVGFGMVFASRRAEQHWSEPTSTVEADAGSERSGAP